MDASGTNNKFAHNKIHDINTSGSNTGSAVGVGGTGSIIDANLIYHVGHSTLDHGIYVYTVHGHSLTNNIVGNTSGYGIHLWHDPHHINIFNNTTLNNGQSGILVGAGEESDSNATGCVVANNIAYHNAEYGIGEFGITGKNIYVDNLTFGNPSGGYRLQGGNSQSGSVNADPQFVNYNAFGTGNYQLRPSSPAIDRASAKYAPSSDFDGKNRPVGRAPDIGAYEFRK